MNKASVGSDRDSSIRALWASVLHQALMDWLGVGMFSTLREKRKIGEAAGEWFQSEQFEPGSFRWVCSYLDIHPDVIRGQLICRHQLKERVARQGARWNQKVNPSGWCTRRERANGQQ